MLLLLTRALTIRKLTLETILDQTDKERLISGKYVYLDNLGG